MYKRLKILVTCSKGVADILAEEIQFLGLPVTEKLVGGVRTEGDWETVMRLNLYLRTAIRVLAEVGTFEAPDPTELYYRVREFEWEDLIPTDGYFCVNSSVVNEQVTDTRFPNMKVKDAIVDRIKFKTGKRPDSGSNQHGCVVFLHWHDGHGEIYMDSSGAPLTRRGYRQSMVEAPMQEALAAAVVLASGWHGETHVINPMCGSGTLAIEAMLYATQSAPGLTRENFAFFHRVGHNEEMWKNIFHQARRDRFKTFDYKCRASDLDEEAIKATGSNAVRAGCADLMTVRTCDFRDAYIPDGKGIVLLNPPYGERLGEHDELVELYNEIGTFIKHQCMGYKVYVISSSVKLLKQIQLKPDRDWTLYNGPLECRLNEYSVF